MNSAARPLATPPGSSAPSRRAERQRLRLVRALQERAREDELPGLALAALHLEASGGRNLEYRVACHIDVLDLLGIDLADETATMAALGAAGGLPCRVRSLRALAALLEQTAASLETIAVDELGPSAEVDS